MDDNTKVCHRKVLLNCLRSLPLSAVWVNGKIEQTVGTDILIINDGTGRAKISKCDAVQSSENRSWVAKGAHCCVIGYLVNTKGIPEITPNKIINISGNAEAIKSWQLEVQDLNLYLDDKHHPALLPENSVDEFIKI